MGADILKQEVTIKRNRDNTVKTQLTARVTQLESRISTSENEIAVILNASGESFYLNREITLANTSAPLKILVTRKIILWILANL